MNRNGWCFPAAVALAIGLPSPAAAQMASWQDIQAGDIATMKDKFLGLAQEFDESQYGWRPMEGVRSVKDVLALMITECHLFPTAWGHSPPAGAEAGFPAEMQRAGGLSRTEIIAELNSSFDHMIGIVRGMSDADRTAESTYFGREMPVHANIATATADMHEHLGQLIAYARTNSIVPPWSR